MQVENRSLWNFRLCLVQPHLWEVAPKNVRWDKCERKPLWGPWNSLMQPVKWGAQIPHQPHGCAFASLTSRYMCPTGTFLCGQQEGFGAGRHSFQNRGKIPGVCFGADAVLTPPQQKGEGSVSTSLLYPLHPDCMLCVRDLFHPKVSFKSLSFPVPYPGWQPKYLPTICSCDVPV